MNKKVLIFLLVFLFAAVVIFLLNRDDEEQAAKIEKDTILSEDEIRNKHLFTNNDLLEKLIEDLSKRNSSIRIFSPSIGDTVNSVVNFRWNPSAGYKSYVITILNNKNKKIWQRKISSNSIRYSGALSPGLYYWKLETESGLAKAGKFFVSE